MIFRQQYYLTYDIKTFKLHAYKYNLKFSLGQVGLEVLAVKSKCKANSIQKQMTAQQQNRNCSKYQQMKSKQSMKTTSTWKCELFRHRAIWRNRGTMHRWNSGSWVASNTSSNSLRNMTSFELFVTGQYFNNPLMTVSASLQSFSTNCVMQYDNCWWYIARHFGLCKGINARTRNNLCSSFRGRANPLMILPKISKSSAIPLCFSVSNINR